MFALIYASAVYCLLSSRHNAVCLLAVSRVFCDLLIESPSLLVEPHVNSGVTILSWSRSHCPVFLRRWPSEVFEPCLKVV